MKFLRRLALAAVLLVSARVSAQTYYDPVASSSSGGPQFYGSVTYQLGIPIGNTHAYIQDVAWRGIGVDLQWMVKPTISVGVALGWNVFFQNVTTTITDPNGGTATGTGIAITGNQDRAINFFPLLADARYLFRLKSGVRPFIGAGIGGYITEEYLGIGLYALTKTAFLFGLAPEAGVIIPIDGGAAIQFSARYNMAFGGNGISFQQWLGLNLGVAWGPGL
jgi:opacity protein-like surface antigen